MKAMVYTRYGPPDLLALQEVPTPEPGDGEVRIRIRAASCSSADASFRRGEPLFARLFTGLLKPKQSVLGVEFAGEIDKLGQGITRFAVGDAVYAANGTDFGGHAEYVCLPEDGAIAIKPANASFEEAAAIAEGFLTALPFLRDAGKIERGQSVLVNGASGSVGTAAVQLAHHFGASVTGVCSAKNVELVTSLGADAVIDYAQEDFTQNGQTYDIVFDAVGKRSFSDCKRSLNPGGVYLTTVPSLAILPQMLWTSKLGSRRAAIAFTGLRPTGVKARDLGFIRELAESGAIKAVIGNSYPLAQTAEAHRYVETGHKVGSAIITMGAMPT